MQKQACTLLSCLLSLILVACQVPVSQTGSNSFLLTSLPHSQGEPASAAFQDRNAQAQAAYIQELKQRIRQKTPYHGPIEVQVQTGLMQHNTGKAVSVPDMGFSLQAKPEGEVVFQERFTRAQGAPLQVQRDFSVSDTSLSYTLHIENGDQNGQNRTTAAVVNLNGFDWVRPNDFKGPQTSEVFKPSILLNANNTLTVDINGAPGSTMLLTLVAAGEAGVIRRRNGPMNAHPTQAAHLKAHDRTIFDPSDPNSLGGLTPAEGEVLADDIIPITGLQVNESDLIRYESGMLIGEFASPEALETFKTLYNATVVDTLNNFHLLKVDLSKSPIQRTHAIIKAYNQHTPEDIRAISFASLAGFQTFLIMLDMIVNHNELIKSLELNALPQGGQVSNPPSVDVDDIFFENNPPPSFPRSQWLFDTRTPEAWNYTLGTGVTVAWIDGGYHPGQLDIEPTRLLLGKENNQVCIRFPFKINCGNNDIFHEQIIRERDTPCSLYHGTCTLLTGFAQRDNGIFTAGVAPNAKLIPYSMLTFWDATDATDAAVRNGADLIGSAKYLSFPEWSEYLGDTGDEIALDLIYHIFGGNSWGDAIDRAVSSGIVFVAISGNKTIARQRTIPSRNLNTITVGATKLNEEKIWEIADFSGYGSDMIWAPGDAIFIAAPSGNPLNPITQFSGTSAAAPLVAGTIALMLSRNPSLSPQQIKHILKITSAIDVHSPIGYPVTVSEKMLDVLGAVSMSATTTPASGNNQPPISHINNLFAPDLPLAQNTIHPVSGLPILAFNQFLFDSDIFGNSIPEVERSLNIVEFAPKMPPGSKSLLEIRGWSGPPFLTANINMGKHSVLGSGQVEVLKSNPIHPVPQVHNVFFDPLPPRSEEGFRILIDGDNLYSPTIPIQLAWYTAGTADSLPPIKIFPAVFQQNDGHRAYFQVLADIIPPGLYELKITTQNHSDIPVFSATGGFNVTAAPIPEPTPSPSPTINPSPGPTPTPMPTPTTSPTPPVLTPITLSSTQAFRQPDFSYRYVIDGTNMGIGPQDFNHLRVRLNSGTQTLVQNGQSQVNNVSLKSLSITPSKIEFVLAGYTPFHGDRSQLVFRRSSSPNEEQVSNALSWQVFN